MGGHVRVLLRAAPWGGHERHGHCQVDDRMASSLSSFISFSCLTCLAFSDMARLSHLAGRVDGRGPGEWSPSSPFLQSIVRGNFLDVSTTQDFREVGCEAHCF